MADRLIGRASGPVGDFALLVVHVDDPADRGDADARRTGPGVRLEE